MDDEQHKQAVRMAKRASMPVQDLETKSAEQQANEERTKEARERKEWESTRSLAENVKDSVSNGPKASYITTGKQPVGRSALSNRQAKNGKPDLFMGNIDKSLDPKEFADSKKALEDELENKGISKTETTTQPIDALEEAEIRTSEIVAQAGAGSAFQGKTLGIGGLDDVLSQIKRRVWTPLAAPPSLLKELGINPVRGLL